MLYKNVVTEETYFLLNDRIMKDKLFEDFFLVGGTALALQMGHRKSVDLDLFTKKDINIEKLKKYLFDNYNFEMAYEGENTLKGFIGDIQIDCIKYDYKLLNDYIIEDNIRMLSKEDIIPMKIVAIIQDGKRMKDFIDIAFLLKEYSLNDMMELYEKKYGFDSSMSIIKAITYFENIDIGENVNMIVKDFSFEKVKKQLIDAVNNPNKIMT